MLSTPAERNQPTDDDCGPRDGHLGEADPQEKPVTRAKRRPTRASERHGEYGEDREQTPEEDRGSHSRSRKREAPAIRRHDDTRLRVDARDTHTHRR